MALRHTKICLCLLAFFLTASQAYGDKILSQNEALIAIIESSKIYLKKGDQITILQLSYYDLQSRLDTGSPVMTKETQKAKGLVLEVIKPFLYRVQLDTKVSSKNRISLQKIINPS